MDTKLTKEQALSYHRQMWSDMQRDLGDCPEDWERGAYKYEWCQRHFPGQEIENGCFLCEYNAQEYGDGNDCNQRCLIKWSSDFGCISFIPEEDYKYMSISTLLALPDRPEYVFKNRMGEQYTCDECKYNNYKWYEMPCDACCGKHSAFERKDINNEGTQSISV